VNRLRAVVFDLDDTLYRERRFALSGFAAVAAAIEQSTGRDAAECFRLFTSAMRGGRRAAAFQDACDALGLDRAGIGGWLDVYRSHAPRLRLPASTRSVLERLRGGWRLGILTNGVPAVQRAKVAALRLAPLVNAIVYADEHVEGGKPAPAPFLEVLARLGVEPSQVVLVGDNLATDIAGGHSAGMRTVWLRRRASIPGPDFSPACADVSIHSLTELPPVLERLGIQEVAHAH
jgi:putative hydrolase of the HAD superfamily